MKDAITTKTARILLYGVAAVALGIPEAGAQQPLPPVDVIQQQPQQRPRARRQAPRPAQPAPAQTTAQPQEVYAGPDVEDGVDESGRRPDGRMVENAPTISPVNPTSILPGDLTDFAGSATRVTREDQEQKRPAEVHEALGDVPGVATVNDDGQARHSGIGIRGAPIRRSRKTLILEDGQSVNFSTYIDPSTHYTPPLDRIEAIEVIRGAVFVQGPLTNHGVVNFQNLNPFGAPETVVKAAFGHTEGSKDELNFSRHIHHRQQVGNFGFVASYTGSDASGAWDNERLRYNDFYASLGWRGADQDLTVSGVYFRQRDRYDEANFELEDWEEFGRCKTCVDPLSKHNNYNSELIRLQAVHNYYVDADTTISSRLYGQWNDRPRFQVRESGDEWFMRGREREYHHAGVESRVELANRDFVGGLKQDIQVGVRYEHHTFDNKNTKGDPFEVLDWDNRGSQVDDLLENYEADAFSAFLQTAIHLTPTVTVIPGVRFESYDVKRVVKADGDRDIELGDDPLHEKSEFDNVLPGVGVSWKATELTNVYASVHRGHTPHVARGEPFPMKNEIGVNYQLGVRTTEITGLTLEAAVFHSEIENYQIKEATVTPVTEANIFGTVDEVEIDGFEIAARLDSRPFVPGPLNFFGKAVYTFADSVITEGENDDGDDVSGNLLPEVPRHVAALTVGVEHDSGWDLSVTWSYRGGFYTDIDNTKEIDDEGEEGFVDGVWLLSARANYHIPDTDVTLFVSGTNLEDKLYITDLADGIKPGQGRTIWGGFTYKLK